MYERGRGREREGERGGRRKGEGSHSVARRVTVMHGKREQGKGETHSLACFLPSLEVMDERIIIPSLPSLAITLRVLLLMLYLLTDFIFSTLRLLLQLLTLGSFLTSFLPSMAVSVLSSTEEERMV